MFCSFYYYNLNDAAVIFENCYFVLCSLSAELSDLLHHIIFFDNFIMVCKHVFTCVIFHGIRAGYGML